MTPESVGLEVVFTDACDVPEVSAKIAFDLEAFTQAVLSVVGIDSGRFEFTLMDDVGISDIHERHLGVPGPTDIVTYNLADSGYLVDIYIGLPTVFENAKEYGVTPNDELKLVIVHGVLHSMGYEDATTEERDAMFAEQDRVLAMVHEALNQ